MSKGIGGVAVKALEDDYTVIYSYGSYDLNRDGYQNEEHLYDGILTIRKSERIAPVIHPRSRRRKERERQQVLKGSAPSASVGGLLEEGQVTIENSTFCTRRTPTGIDKIAVSLVGRAIAVYQATAVFPDRVSLDF